MFRPRWAHVLSFGIAMAFAAQTAEAQSGVDTIYHLHGSVVDGVTGKPIGRALVTSMDRRLAVMTNGEGHFSVDLSVPANGNSRPSGLQPRFGGTSVGPSLQLMAQRPNFLQNMQPVNVSLDDSLDGKEIVLRLMPGAAIAGHVTAAGIDSTRGVQISLLRRQVMDGAYSWVPAGSQAANAEGAFRFTHLEPGEYTVMSSEWAGERVADIDFNRVSAQYPPDFLGDTPSFEGATKLQLHYGEEVTAALHLHTALYFPVVVPVQNEARSQAQDQAQSQPQGTGVSVRIIGANTFNGFSLGWNGKQSAVTGALPSGSYTLLISSFGPHPSAVTVPLTVAGHAVQHAPVTLAAGSHIPVRVHVEYTASDTTNTGGPQAVTSTGGRERPSEVNLWLRPEDVGSGTNGGGMRTREDGATVIESAQPGRYLVQANAFRGYVAALTSGNVDLLRAPLVVSDSGSADPIDVTVRDDAATLSGTVDSPGDTSAGPTVLMLLPTDGSLRMNQGFAFGSSNFNIGNIAPGTYRLLALTGGRQQQQLPYRDPQAMKPYNNKGLLVTLSAGQKASVHVSLTNLDDNAK